MKGDTNLDTNKLIKANCLEKNLLDLVEKFKNNNCELKREEVAKLFEQFAKEISSTFRK